MLREIIQVQLSNGLSLEALTEGGSVQALFIARRSLPALLNPVNSDTIKLKQ